MFKVLIADKLSEEAVRIFSDNGIEAIVKNGLDENALIEALQDCDGLVVRSATKATKKVIESCKKLKVIGRAGIGVDNVDLEAATNNGKVVMNTPFGNSITTAEHAITLILSTALSTAAGSTAPSWPSKLFRCLGAVWSATAHTALHPNRPTALPAAITRWKR